MSVQSFWLFPETMVSSALWYPCPKPLVEGVSEYWVLLVELSNWGNGNWELGDNERELPPRLTERFRWFGIPAISEIVYDLGPLGERGEEKLQLHSFTCTALYKGCYN